MAPKPGKAGPDHNKLFEIASQQAGYFTSEQSRRYGFNWDVLSYHTRKGHFLRVRRGLYRLARFPASPHEEIIAAQLAFGLQEAVVSHESALQLFDLADVLPIKVHLTVPRAKRSRKPPPGVKIHTALNALKPRDTVIRQGIRVTTVARSIADSAAYGTAPEQIVRAAQEALRRGLATRSELFAAGRRHGDRGEKLIRQAVEEVRAG